MFRSLALALSLTAVSLFAAPTVDPLLTRGKASFRAGKLVDAIDDLRAAASAALTPEVRQQYVATGKLDTIAQFEESLVYLALAYDRLGRENEARDAVSRLLNAERITPVFATLQLDADAADFEPLAARLVPSMTLARNERLAKQAAEAPAVVVQPTLAQQRAEMLEMVEERVAAARAEIDKAANEKIAQAQRAAEERVAAERAAAQKAADERVAKEIGAAEKAVQEKIAADRAAAAREAEQRIAAERAALQRTAEERIAAERVAASKAAEEKIASERAALQRTAEERIAAERAAASKAAEEKIANERAALQRTADERIAAERAAASKAAEEKIASVRKEIEQAAEMRIAQERQNAEKVAEEKIAALEADRRRALLMSLRQAETFAIAGQIDEATRIYVALAESPTSTRESLAAAATGLYRTGAFGEAVRAFGRLGTFAPNEVDLRYYYAVSLYEIGKYDQAKTELAAALPRLQRTDDVERYRVKIEQSGPRQARKQ